MRITKNQLRQIIKEELEAVIEEEGQKPDFLDVDKDGDKEEPMKDVAEDAEKTGDK